MINNEANIYYASITTKFILTFFNISYVIKGYTGFIKDTEISN